MDTSVGEPAVYFSAYGGGGGGLYYRCPFNTSITAVDYDPNTLKKKVLRVKKNAIYYDKTQHANFRSKPLFQA